MQENNKLSSNELTVAKQGLLSRLASWTPICGLNNTGIPALSLYRYDKPTSPENYLQEPGICLIAQGTKRVLMNDSAFQNDPDHYLLTVMDLPVVTSVIKASPEKPYLALSLKIDLRMISQLILDNGMPSVSHNSVKQGMIASDIDLSLIHAFNRLFDLLNEPDNIPILAPLIQREILYRLLIGEQGPHLRQIALVGSQSNQIVRTIEWLKKNYTKPLKVEDMASYSQMSPSTFHHHFRQLTEMSPLQYQKWLRLQEARRLMLAEKMDVANAAFVVGYESPSQFSREYSRMFKAPPSQDIKMLRNRMNVS